ncbi:uncharacterized [Tachysurus ichikawai]
MFTPVTLISHVDILTIPTGFADGCEEHQADVRRSRTTDPEVAWRKAAADVMRALRRDHRELLCASVSLRSHGTPLFHHRAKLRLIQAPLQRATHQSAQMRNGLVFFFSLDFQL